MTDADRPQTAIQIAYLAEALALRKEIRCDRAGSDASACLLDCLAAAVADSLGFEPFGSEAQALGSIVQDLAAEKRIGSFDLRTDNSKALAALVPQILARAAGADLKGGRLLICDRRIAERAFPLFKIGSLFTMAGRMLTAAAAAAGRTLLYGRPNLRRAAAGGLLGLMTESKRIRKQIGRIERADRKRSGKGTAS